MSLHTVNKRIAEVAIRFQNVGKRFGQTVAVDNVTLEISRGSVHALVGENGAGKSTLLGMLTGRIRVTEGQIEVFGRHLNTGDVRAARAAGIVAIYQELTIVPRLSACANVFLGQQNSRFGILSERAMRRRFNELCERFSLATIPAHVEAGTLSVADQQMLEVLRAFQSNARILLLDEPTSSLAPPERQALFRCLRELRTQGVTMLLVSHNLDEVLSIADQVSVCRDGHIVRTALAADWTKASLVAGMLGRVSPRRTKREARANKKPFLRAEGVTVPGKIDNLSVTVSPGEIVGVGGLVGSGRTTFLRALYGLEPQTAGCIWIDEKQQAWPASPSQALQLGIALIPEDRKQGLVFGIPAQENIVLANFYAAARAGIISEQRLKERAERAIHGYQFDRTRLSVSTGSLSGGNQQKLLLARWRHRSPRLLLADEPTRGVDVGAKEEILNKLRDLADDGLGVLFVSSELEEVLTVSDRILVIAAGREVGRLEGTASVADILATAFSVKAG